MRKEVIEKLKELPPEKAQELIDLVMKLDTLEVNSIVYHDKFGKGNVTKINKNEKFIYVKFDFGGEKKFIFPDAFSMGFLKFEKWYLFGVKMEVFYGIGCLRVAVLLDGVVNITVR